MLVPSGCSAGLSVRRLGFFVLRSLAVIVVGCLGQGCRHENPEFNSLRDEAKTDEETVDSSEMEGEGTDSSVLSDETEPEKSTTTDQGTEEESVSEDAETSSVMTSEVAGSSDSPSSSQGTSTGTTTKYCAQEARFCYLVDSRDSGIIIEDARGGIAPMTIAHGKISSHEQGLPADARVLTVSQDDPAAVSTVKWTPPVEEGVAFDAYIKLSESPSYQRLLFGLRNRLVLGLSDSGRAVCAFNETEVEANYVSSMDDGVVDANWHHYGCEYDGVNVTLWIDGRVGPKVPATIPPSIPSIPIGEVGGNGGVEPIVGKKGIIEYGHFRGSISAIRIWTDLAAFRAAMKP